jgi:RNA recognition motif-containing protein
MSTATTTDEKQPIPNQVFVGGMTPETSIQQLTKHFESLKLQPAGPPTFFQTPDGVSKGCALVPFATPEAQAAAITALSGSKLGEQALVARPDRGPRRVRREVNQDGTYLYVGNLDPDVTVTELHELFAPEGKLTYCNISRKRRSERSLGWATVRLNSDEAAQKAQESLNGKTFKERVLTVEPLKSIPRPARKPRVRKEREPRDPNLPALENVEQPAADPCVVWVGNLPFTTTEDTLRPLFAESGEVKDVVITRDKRSKESRGWGTVTFATPEAAAAAVSKLNGTTFEERAMNVQIRRGPRVRRRRQPAQAAADTQATDSEQKEKPRRRRPRRFRQPRGDGEEKPQRQRRREGKSDEGQGQTQDSQAGGEEGKGRRSRARRPRNDTQKNDQETTTVHVNAEGGEQQQKGRRRRRRRSKPADGETGDDAGQDQQAKPRRERKEPDRIVDNPACHLYVRNVPFTATADDLKAHFEKAAGPVVSATITVNTKGLSRGWGTVEMASPENATKALALDKTDFQGRSLFVRVDNRVYGAE